jgi:SAM-dependent methyltransferase
MARAIDVATAHTAAFVRRVAPRARSMLEVGGGEGDLAAALAGGGCKVVMIDADAGAVEAARAKGVDAHRAEWPHFKTPPVDCVLFTRSLHHIDDLDAALAAARGALAPAGVAAIEDFAFHDAGDGTIRELAQLAHRLFAEDAPIAHSFIARLLAAEDPVACWREPTGHDVRAFAEIESAAARAFARIAVEAAPYFYRYVVAALPQSGDAGAVAADAFQFEKELISAGRVSPIGRRLVAGR